MTKKEMMREIISGLHYIDNEGIINDCVNKITKEHIEKVYNYYKTHDTHDDKELCMKLLMCKLLVRKF